MENIKLINGDCLEIMKDISDKSVDMILTDIPYDMVNRKTNGLRVLDKGKADIITFDLSLFLSECVRICKGSIYIFCGAYQFSKILKYFSENGMSVRTMIYEKTNPSPMNGDVIWLSGVELCAYGRFPKATFNGHCRNTVLRYPSGHSKIHPTEKNLDLFTDLVLTSSNKGDVILDPCMGSGTAGVAAVLTDRKFIGIELDEKYFKIANKRVSDAVVERNSRLF